MGERELVICVRQFSESFTETDRKIKRMNHSLTLSCHFLTGEETFVQLVFTE